MYSYSEWLAWIVLLFQIFVSNSLVEFSWFLCEYITGVRVPGISEYIFNFTQSGQVALQNDCTNLQSHYVHEITTFIQPSPALVPSSYLISVNGMVLKWGLILFCISLIPNKENHPLIQLINIWVSISVNCLLNPLKILCTDQWETSMFLFTTYFSTGSRSFMLICKISWV